MGGSRAWPTLAGCAAAASGFFVVHVWLHSPAFGMEDKAILLMLATAPVSFPAMWLARTRGASETTYEIVGRWLLVLGPLAWGAIVFAAAAGLQALIIRARTRFAARNPTGLP